MTLLNVAECPWFPCFHGKMKGGESTGDQAGAGRVSLSAAEGEDW